LERVEQVRKGMHTDRYGFLNFDRQAHCPP
jgi:hypothetical protein